MAKSSGRRIQILRQEDIPLVRTVTRRGDLDKSAPVGRLHHKAEREFRDTLYRRESAGAGIAVQSPVFIQAEHYISVLGSGGQTGKSQHALGPLLQLRLDLGPAPGKTPRFPVDEGIDIRAHIRGRKTVIGGPVIAVMGDNYPRPIRSFRLRSDRELDSGEFRRIRIPDFFIASRSNEDGHCHSDACQEPKNCSFHPNTISVKVLGMQIYNFIQK